MGASARRIGTFVAVLSACALFTFAHADVALAHTPHDDIFDVALSPNFARDHLALTISRGILFRSTDGGLTWTRVVRGLDNRYDLYSLQSSPSNARVYFVTSLGDGVYKSTDQGLSWRRVDDGLATRSIRFTAVAPGSANVVFAAGEDGGLSLTTTGGRVWQTVLGSNVHITALAFLPDRPGHVVAGDDRGTLRVSTNGGRTWKPSPLSGAGTIRSIAAPANYGTNRTFFVGTAEHGLFKTTNAGASFQRADAGLTDPSIFSVVISSSYASDSTLWVSTWDQGVFSSHDGGATWARTSQGLTTDPQEQTPAYKDRPNFGPLRVSAPAGPGRTMLQAGFAGLFRSTDDGGSWQQVQTLSASIVVGLAVSPQYARDGTVAVTTYIDGAFLSVDRSATWKAINNGLVDPNRYREGTDRIARLFDIVFSPNYASDHTMFSALPTGILRSTTNGREWSQILPAGTTVHDPPREYIITVSPNFAADKTVVLGDGSSGDMFRSTDGGATFSRLRNLGHLMRCLVASPGFAHDGTLLAGTGHGVFVSTNRGSTWSPIGLDTSNIAALALSPGFTTDKTAFAGTLDGLFVTKDAGHTWTRVSTSAFAPTSSVEAVAVSPNFSHDGTVLATVQGRGLFKSTDGGATFVAVAPALIASNQQFDNFSKATSSAIVFSPAFATDHTAYGFSGTDLFQSTDAGNTWHRVDVPRTLHALSAPPPTSPAATVSGHRAPWGRRVLIGAAAALLAFLILCAFRFGGMSTSRKLMLRSGVALVVFALCVAVQAR